MHKSSKNWQSPVLLSEHEILSNTKGGAYDKGNDDAGEIDKREPSGT